MLYLSTRELADAAQLSPPYIRDCVQRGELEAIPIGHGKRRILRYPVDEAIRFFRAKGFRVPAEWLTRIVAAAAGLT